MVSRVIPARFRKHSRGRSGELGRKLGRNKPCPCGSGRKYKKCCGGASAPPALFRVSGPHKLDDEDRARLAKIELKEKLRTDRFGHVRGIISAQFQGHRMVAVGSEIHYNKNWHTFVDFLFDYIGRFFSREWYLDEKARGADAHPFVGWIDGALPFRMGGDPEPDGTRSAVPSGPAMAFLLVAYDLYVLHDFRLIHDDLAARLLHKDQFQGARYELAVAAVMVRADCEIVMEDETDKSKKHHEFDCERRITSERISVEAKSKHRHGVMGYTRGKRVDIDKQKAGFRRLLTAATEKPTEHARIIFVELNLPARETSDQIRSWEAEIEKIISSVLKTHGGECPWSMLVLTNRPHHYGSEDEPTPTCSALIHVPTDPVVKLSEDTIRAIQTAVNQSDRIPNWFSEDDEYQE